MATGLETQQEQTSGLTEDEFFDHPDCERYELVDGKMKERGMSYESAWISNKVAFAFTSFAEKSGGQTCGDGAEFRCFGKEGRNIRKPDATYIRPGRMVDIPRSACEVVPDILVEVVSPNDRVFDLHEKLKTYRAAAVPVVVVIYPDSRTAEIRHRESVTTIGEEETITFPDQMPGFELRLADVLPPVA